MSVRKAADLLNVAPNTASKALKALCDHGFIRPNVVGSFNWKMRHATTWVLTEHMFRGSPPTREYQQWSRGRSKKKPVSNLETSVSSIDTDILGAQEKTLHRSQSVAEIDTDFSASASQINTQLPP